MIHENPTQVGTLQAQISASYQDLEFSTHISRICEYFQQSSCLNLGKLIDLIQLKMNYEIEPLRRFEKIQHSFSLYKPKSLHCIVTVEFLDIFSKKCEYFQQSSC